MRSERVWILILALVAFSAGMAAGVLLSFRQHPAREAGPFHAFESRMIETFDLDPERVRNLRYILQDYQERIEALKERNIAALDPELVRIGETHRDLIRTWVVPERHRQEYDLWQEGLPAVAGGRRPQ